MERSAEDVDNSQENFFFFKKKKTLRCDTYVRFRTFLGVQSGPYRAKNGVRVLTISQCVQRFFVFGHVFFHLVFSHVLKIILVFLSSGLVQRQTQHKTDTMRNNTRLLFNDDDGTLLGFSSPSSPLALCVCVCVCSVIFRVF